MIPPPRVSFHAGKCHHISRSFALIAIKKRPPCPKRTQRTSQTRGTTSVYRLRGLIGYSHQGNGDISAALYRAHPSPPTTHQSFGARLRTVIGTPHLRSLAPPATLCGRSPRRLTECPSSLSNNVADTLLLCGAKVNSQFHQDMPRGKATGCAIIRQIRKTHISTTYEKRAVRKHGKTREKSVDNGRKVW